MYRFRLIRNLLIWFPLLIIAFLVWSCGKAPSINKSDKKDKDPNSQEQTGENTSGDQTGDPNAPPIVNGGRVDPGGGGGVAGAGDFMLALLADCGSPFADLVAGSFALTGQDIAFSFSKNDKIVTTSDGREWEVTDTGIDSIITVAGKDAGSLPAYSCSNLQAETGLSIDGYTNVTKRYLTVREGPKSSLVAWLTRPGGVDGIIYRITIVVNNILLSFDAS